MGFFKRMFSSDKKETPQVVDEKPSYTLEPVSDDEKELLSVITSIAVAENFPEIRVKILGVSEIVSK